MPEMEFNLVAPHPIEDCVRRLQRYAHHQNTLTLKTRVEFISFKNGNYHFRILRSFYSLPVHRRPRLSSGYQRSNYVKLQVDGYLTRWPDSGSTLVVAEAKVLPKTYVINGIILISFALLLLLMTTAFLANFLCMAPLILLTLFSFARTTLLQPEELAQQYKRGLLLQIQRALI